MMAAWTFDDVWQHAESIEGYFSKKAACALYNCAVLCDEGAQLVEIGCFCGRSSSILGLVAKHNGYHLTLVDNFAFKRGARQAVYNLWNLGISFTLMVMESAKAAALFDKPIDLLHIDARHSAIQQDIAMWTPKLKKGGWMLCHDYGPGWPHIREAVDSLGYEKYGVFSSLAARRKATE